MISSRRLRSSRPATAEDSAWDSCCVSCSCSCPPRCCPSASARSSRRSVLQLRNRPGPRTLQLPQPLLMLGHCPQGYAPVHVGTQGHVLRGQRQCSAGLRVGCTDAAVALLDCAAAPPVLSAVAKLLLASPQGALPPASTTDSHMILSHPSPHTRPGNGPQPFPTLKES